MYDEQGQWLLITSDQHPCFMIMVSVDNSSGPAPQRKEECTLQCAFSSKEEKSSCILQSSESTQERIAGYMGEAKTLTSDTDITNLTTQVTYVIWNLFYPRSLNAKTFITLEKKVKQPEESLDRERSDYNLFERKHAEYDESNTYVLERFNTTAGNPVKKILLKLNLSDHRKLKEGGEVKEFQRSFRHSDTERLSRSDEVLKLKNFKKDATLKLSKSSNQEWYEHVGPEVASPQDGKVSRWRKEIIVRYAPCSPYFCESAGSLPVGKLSLHFPSLTTNECHYAERFTDAPNKKYVEGEIAFVDMIKNAQFKLDFLNTVLNSLGYENDDEVLFYYKIPLKSLDIRLKPLDSTSDEDEEGDSENDSEFEDGHSNANDIVDEEHLVDEVEVNMSSFKFQLDGEGEVEFIDPIQPHVTVTEDDLEVLEFDSLESDQEDVPKNARSRGLRNLRKKATSSSIRNNFFVGKEFANMDLAKERIRAYSIESRRNLDFKRNDKRIIRVICKGVVPTLTSKNKYMDTLQGPKEGISRKGKAVIKDAKEDKISCPWVLYLTKGDKAKWVVKTYKDEHNCLQSKQIKTVPPLFFSKHIIDLITMNPEIPIKAIQEQMKKKFHVLVSRTKAFRAKAQVHLRGDVKVQYSLLRDYVSELHRCNLDTTVKIDVYGEEDPEKTTRMFKRIYVCLGALKRGFKEAMGVDANNGIYPVAYGIVESENQYSWTWFLTFLGDDFDLFSNSNFTFITNMQKGLLPATTKLFPSAEHRKWEISGIPCKHAIAAIHDMVDNVNGIDMWSKFDYPTTLLPPKVHTQIGRPPKKRKKSKGEIEMVKGDKLTRKGKTVTYSLCQGTGHNKRGCKATSLSDGGQRNSMPSQTMPTQHVANQPRASQTMVNEVVAIKHVQKKRVGNKRTASQTSNATNQVATQGSQASSQASTAPTSPT
ncbi:mutator type transposase [Tanacetum coccineum]